MGSLHRLFGRRAADVWRAEARLLQRLGYIHPPEAVQSVPDGTVLGVWRRPLEVSQPLPTIPLALTVRESIPIDLEHTYREAARRVYLD